MKDAGVPFAEAETFLAWMKTVIENDGAKAGELTLNADFTVLFDDDMFREKHLVACSRPSEVRQSLLSRQKQKDGKDSPLNGILSIIILIAGAAITEIMIYQFRNLPFLSSVDLRFIYILVIAMSGDGLSGFFAALIECLFLFRLAVSGGSTNYMIFFNPDNWSTYLLYILLGTGVGYARGHQRQEAEIIRMERDFEKKQNLELKDLYQQLLDKKNEYRVNLENSKNGFGKLYQAFTRLSSVEPEKIMAESIPVLEDLLSNQTVSVYSVYESNRNSARLQVASSRIYKEMPRSLMVSDHPDMMQALLRDTIWFNRDLNENDPMYAAPIIDQGQLIAFIVVKEADFYQTSLYYQNLLFVLSRIIGNLIITALNYQREIQRQNFIEGTNILNRDAMKHRMELLEKMKDNNISGYRILEITMGGLTIQQIDQKLQHLIRPLDVVGQPEEEGKLLLIAANADDVGAQIVRKRLAGAGLICEVRG